VVQLPDIPSRLDAYRRLRAGILANEFPDDQPLSERRLAEQLGLGRMPVREALKDLERDGLVEVRPLRGTCIRRLSFDEVRDLYEVRFGLETLAASLAARRGATPGLLAAGDVLARLREAGTAATSVELQDAGGRLHAEIFLAARNAQLRLIHDGLRLQLDRNHSFTREAEPARIRQTLPEHLAIFEAIRDGDASAAQRAMHRHLMRSLAVRMRILGADQPQAARPRRLTKAPSPT
jgi:DNA-binding GntR family transcriptional regulator